MNRRFLLATLFLSAFFYFSLAPTVPAGRASHKTDFYFYYPDSTLTNLSRLKYNMDMLLREGTDTVQFQPFHHKVDFDRMVKITRPALVLLPEWYYRSYGKELDLTPVLTPIRDGRSDYTKVLLVRKKSPYTLDNLSGLTIAMTPMGPHTVEYLNKELFAGKNVDFSSCHILNVGKDADALFSVALGQVDAALIGTDTLKMMSQMNKKLTDTLKSLSQSSPIPLPLLCVRRGDMNGEDVKRVTQHLFEQGRHSALPEIMEILQIDGWQKITN
ncbi:MAG: phosphate/phosphite/phosphonate ABC transporter substrate-binding protein [Desulfobulbaceae bacterium]|nr:phosphate/phosphite/phosphonate ABC transporter substrate-binding protein [Desulfobulbaceae bacterium]